MIEIISSSFPHIGRAKARFLGGDRSGAVSDLDVAANLHPNDATIEGLRSQIADGLLLASNTSAQAWQRSTSANEVLAQGNGEEAFKMYSQAQEMGFNRIFSTFNKAMACSLIKDADGATYFLDQFTPVPDSPTELNSLSLRAIIAAIAKSGYAACIPKI